MVIADQYFSFGVGPPTRKSTKVSFLGASGNICDTGRVGSNWSLSRFSSQAVSSRKSSAGDLFDLTSVVTIFDGTTAVTCRSRPAFASLNHSRHDIPSSTAGQSSLRQFAASHSSSWAAEPTIPPALPSHSPTKRPKFLKDQKFFYLYNHYTDEIHHYYDDRIEKFAHQLFIRSEFLLQFIQDMTNSLVKGIYAGFVMVESKCIEVDKEQASHDESKFAPNNSNMHSLIALQSTLLHEHHDFFLASQHPSANPAPRRLA
ncbi:uncharacterized protein TrAtP1_005632 [Trichoderma atroviride]|uniref:uncharacterized protein n=1 Tax=Hypocrea atroviridis TaxID=63577 RepID=UPI003330320A|nr:hypothetical protein TrAtP1_005632 [Trichoderma atroviride]